MSIWSVLPSSEDVPVPSWPVGGAGPDTEAALFPPLEPLQPHIPVSAFTSSILLKPLNIQQSSPFDFLFASVTQEVGSLFHVRSRPSEELPSFLGYSVLNMEKSCFGRLKLLSC